MRVDSIKDDSVHPTPQTMLQAYVFASNTLCHCFYRTFHAAGQRVSGRTAIVHTRQGSESLSLTAKCNILLKLAIKEVGRRNDFSGLP